MQKKAKMHVKIGDNVKVISGFDKNKTLNAEFVIKDEPETEVKGLPLFHITGEDDVVVDIHGPHREVPLAHEPAHRGRPDHGEGSQRECRHGQGHPVAEAPELRDVLLAGSDEYGAGAEKQGDLGEGVVDDVDQPAFDGRRGEQGDT